MKITYLHHSGFLCETENYLLIFDYHKDPQQKVEERLAQTDKKVYFFVSHNHWDHFNRDIAIWADSATGYILHEDCELPEIAHNRQKKMKPGDTWTEGDLTVTMYGSTDAGGSYYIMVDGHRLFHAGDLNWWHWAGESDEDNRVARDAFEKEIGAIKEKNVDVAFFPVDARQQVAREWGVTYFLEKIEVKELLVAMHAFGAKWIPSYGFLWRFPDVSVWVPEKDGEEKEGVK